MFACVCVFVCVCMYLLKHRGQQRSCKLLSVGSWFTQKAKTTHQTERTIHANKRVEELNIARDKGFVELRALSAALTHRPLRSAAARLRSRRFRSVAQLPDATFSARQPGCLSSLLLAPPQQVTVKVLHTCLPVTHHAPTGKQKISLGHLR